MSAKNNTEQIERHWHYHGKHGGGNRNRYATQLKKDKARIERRKGKQFVEETTSEFNGEQYEDCSEVVPKHASTYNKYHGWEY